MHYSTCLDQHFHTKSVKKNINKSLVVNKKFEGKKVHKVELTNANCSMSTVFSFNNISSQAISKSVGSYKQEMQCMRFTNFFQNSGRQMNSVEADLQVLYFLKQLVHVSKTVIIRSWNDKIDLIWSYDACFCVLN